MVLKIVPEFVPLWESDRGRKENMAHHAKLVPFAKGHKKTGGRKKGTLNKATVRRNAIIAEFDAEVEAWGKDHATASPLACMAAIMRIRMAQRDLKGALEAASAAAPYVHARLNATDLNVHHSLTDRSDSEVAQEITQLRAKVEHARQLALGHTLVIDGEAKPSAQTAEPQPVAESSLAETGASGAASSQTPEPVLAADEGS
jgi:hypothetical protein